MTPDEQLTRWVAGDSVHDHDQGQCCPDFSCCRPALLAPEYERVAFRDGDEAERNVMLMSFLGRLLDEASVRDKVHLVGELQPTND